MPAIVDCPICSRKLRILDNLLGEQVRCPTCGGTFIAPIETAAAPALTAAIPSPVVTETLAPLELGPRQAIPPVPQLHPTLVGEEKGPPDPARAAKTVPTQAQRGSSLGGRLCPGCGEIVNGRAQKCPQCGELLADDEDRPWPYRDCEPHRAGWVLALGIISIVMVTTCVLTVVGLPAGIAAWVMGHRDLGKMRAGHMDPEGMKTTESGRICGIVGTVLNTLVWLYFAFAFAMRLSHAGF